MAGLILGVFSSALTSAEAAVCRAGPRPVAIVLSGGTSLGAYQAGALARALEFFAARPHEYQVQMFAGASAGGINGVLGYQDLCGDQNQRWLKRFWTGPITERLFRPNAETGSLLNREAFAPLESQFRADFEKSHHRCEAVLSVALTLADPLRVEIPGDQASQSQFLTFNLRLSPGSPAQVTNFVNPFDSATSSMLHLDAKNPATDLMDLARATSSIPLIFPAQKLRYCAMKRDDPTLRHAPPPFHCPANDVRTGAFIDGALLDTTPLAQAVRQLKRGLVRDCTGLGSKWLSVPRNENQGEILNDLLILNLDVRNRNDEGRPAQSLAGGVGKLLGDLLKSARDREIVNLLESEPRVRDQILSLRSHFPRWSEEWNGFFGFFDAELRKFDFAVGYVDMEKSLRTDRQSARESGALVQCLRAYAEKPTATCAGLSHEEEILFRTLVREDVNAPTEKPSRFARRMHALSQEGYTFRELDLDHSETAMAPIRVRGQVDRGARGLAKHYPEDSATTLGAVSGYLFGAGDPLPVERVYHLNWGTGFEAGYSQLFGLNYLSGSYWRWPIVAQVYAPSLLSTAPGRTTAITLYSGIEWQSFFSSSVENLVSLRAGYQYSTSDREAPCARGRLEACRGPTLEPAFAVIFFGNFRLQAALKVTFDQRDFENVTAAGLFQGGLQF